jgi:transcriptional regulator with XRE-family HTH domain
VKWQVWIGYQLRGWRMQADEGGGLPQKNLRPLAGLTEPMISRIESGERRVEAVELRALATAYSRRTADIAALFTPPTAAAWAKASRGRAPDPRFSAPPGVRPLGGA